MKKITLKVLRAMNDYTQEDMAKRLGISRVYYNYIETKRVKMSSHVLLRICEEFDLKPSDLIL